MPLHTDQGVIDVKAYGAKGDGVTDDTTALRDALLAAANGTLVIPNGTYLTQKLTVASPTRVILAPGATLKLKDNTNDNLIAVTAADVFIEGGTLDGNKANQTTGSCVYSTGARTTVQEVYAKGAKSYGLYSRADTARFEACRVTDSENIGIFVENATAATDMEGPAILNCIVDRSAIGAAITEGGIKVHGGAVSTMRVMRSVIVGNRVIMPASPVSAAAICIEVWGFSPYATIEGNVTKGGSMGVSVDRSDGTTVMGNTCTGWSLYGLEFADTDYSNFIGNTAESDVAAVLVGVAISTSPIGCIVKGNVVRLPNASATSRGLSCSGGSGQGLIVQGNTIEVAASSTGILIQNMVDLLVQGNKVIMSSAAGTPLGIQVASSCSYIAVVGNYFENSAQICADLRASYATVSANVFKGNGTALQALSINNAVDYAICGNTFYNFTQYAVLLVGSAAFVVNRYGISGNVFDTVATPVGSSLSGGATLGSAIKVKGNSGQVDYEDFGSGVEVKADAIAERTSAAGVTVDGCLIKDGLAADANLLGGQNGAYYRNADNLNAGTVPVARLPAAAAAAIGAVLKAAVLTAPAPTAVTDNSGGTSSSTLAAVGTSTAESSTAQTQDSLTDSTGGTANTTLAQAAAITAAPVDTGAAKLGDVQNFRTTFHDNIADIAAQLAKIRVDVAALNTTVQLAPTKASVDTKLGVLANALASLATIANADRARVEDLYAKLQAAGVIA